MGPQAHFANRSKCGLSRIATEHRGPVSIQHDRHRPVVDELERHARAEDAALDVHSFIG
jgi:hypothetical protein